MTKTALQIKKSILDLLYQSDLGSSINGVICYNGLRPKDSTKEDIVLSFTAGQTDQIQTGILTINIYTLDLEYNGSYYQNVQRCEEIEALAQSFVDNVRLSDGFYIELNQTIDTMADEELHQHFTVVKLKYKLFI